MLIHMRGTSKLALQLGLLGLGSQVGHEEVAHFCGGLVEEVAHAMSTEALADDVEVEAGERKLVFISNFMLIRTKGEGRAHLFSLIMYAIPNPSSITWLHPYPLKYSELSWELEMYQEPE